MKAVRGLIGIICGVAISVFLYAATGAPKHAFKHSYGQPLEELPNVREQLTKADVQGIIAGAAAFLLAAQRLSSK